MSKWACCRWMFHVTRSGESLEIRWICCRESLQSSSLQANSSSEPVTVTDIQSLPPSVSLENDVISSRERIFYICGRRALGLYEESLSMECLNVDATLLHSPSLRQRRPLKQSNTAAFCVLASTATINRKNILEYQSRPQIVYKDVLPLGAQLSTFFHHTPTKDAHAWANIMTTCNQHEDFLNAIEIFYIMQAEGVKAERETIAAALTAVTGLRDFAEGRRIHSLVKELGLEGDVSVGSALMNMYGKDGALAEACNAFEKIPIPDAVAWTAIIGAYCENGTYANVMELLEKMAAENISPIEATYVTIFDTCRMEVDEGKRLSSRMAATSLYWSIPAGTSVLRMFIRNGDMIQAKEAFEKIPDKNAIPYAVIMSAYLNKRLTTESFRYFSDMLEKEVAADSDTCIVALRTAAYSSRLEDGKLVHRTATQYGVDKNPAVQSGLINMYVKCGQPDDARAVFEVMIPWAIGTEAYSAMIGAYAQKGEFENALRIARRMEQEGAHMNRESFLYVLKACVGNANLTDISYGYFRSMIFDYGIKATDEHYAVMINCVNGCPEATKALMDALKAGSDELLRREAKIQEENSIRAGIREQMPGYLKKEGISSITIDNVVHSFTAGDRSQPYAKEVHQEVDRIHDMIRKIGYVPDTSCVRQNVSEKRKEYLLKGHSERLVIAYANMHTPPGTTLRIMKNLRVCEDCHNACKLFAKALQRELIMRDFRRFHYVYKDGTCSCNDYW